jgi:EAL domain-containing protein (putative c-di-GMP-specific phosphodiesterase class I)/GGDEF domain-containing protein
LGVPVCGFTFRSRFALTLDAARLLGFAFANADLLIEIDAGDAIAFALGAPEALSGSRETQLVGRPWRDFVDARDRPMLEALLESLEAGARTGPVVVGLADIGDGLERAASLSAFRMPSPGAPVSCTLSRATRPVLDGVNGLHDKASFEAVTATLFETARATGLELELAFVELGGFTSARKTMSPTQSQDAIQRLAGLLRAQSHGGGAAAELGADRYALVRRRNGETVETLAQRLVRHMAIDPVHGVTAGASAMTLRSDASSSQVLRAIRYSLDSFIRDGMAGANPMSLAEAVSQSVRRTVAEVGQLGDAVAGRKFRLVYQPVVDLKAKGALHHHEVLVRFGDNNSPFPIIRMAEELDLIEPLDLAVVERTVAKLMSDPALSLAVNVSGRTIGSSAFIETIRQILKSNAQARGRLIFELTESAAIEDLALADRHLQALRGEGCRVCLDDFGAGAASLAYLQQLSLDVVKIDGRYIRELQHGGRESTFIRHLVHMCSELGVKTLAEMVETPQVEEAVRRAGVDYAQGWLYGPGADEPGAPLTQQAMARPAPRRMGAVDSWG